ncbi:hypothetical protein [Paenibacillus chartarius]
MKSKWVASAALASLLVPVLSGCTDHNAIKQTAQQAIAKHAEMKSYQFAGSLDLKLGMSLPAPDGNPITGAVLSSLKESVIEWSGVQSSDPVQLETDLKITPKGSATPFAFPVLLKDNKMYVSLPTINKPDEYYAIDLAKLGDPGKTPLNPDSLKNTSKVTAALWSKFTDAIDARWFEQAKDPVMLPDGKPAKAITVTVTEKNAAAINSVISAKLPEIGEALTTGGLLSPEQAAKWKEAKTSLELKPLSNLTLLIDEQGFVRDEKLELVYSLKNADGTVSDNRTTLHESFEQINQPPQFKKDVPAKTKPFEDVLKLLQPKK